MHVKEVKVFDAVRGCALYIEQLDHLFFNLAHIGIGILSVFVILSMPMMLGGVE
jgi:hypothetical protein